MFSALFQCQPRNPVPPPLKWFCSRWAERFPRTATGRQPRPCPSVPKAAHCRLRRAGRRCSRLAPANRGAFSTRRRQWHFPCGRRHACHRRPPRIFCRRRWRGPPSIHRRKGSAVKCRFPTAPASAPTAQRCVRCKGCSARRRRRARARCCRWATPSRAAPCRAFPARAEARVSYARGSTQWAWTSSRKSMCPAYRRAQQAAPASPLPRRGQSHRACKNGRGRRATFRRPLYGCARLPPAWAGRDCRWS